MKTLPNPYLVTVALLLFSIDSFCQSSSPSFKAPQQETNKTHINSNTITFSEFPVGTYISDQYETIGIRFGGSTPFIVNDRSNPTSPVLSGSPIFVGEIIGYMVNPESGGSKAVLSFSIDAGYFDSFGSTRLEWFDDQGRKLGQTTNSQFGIERFTISGGNIHSWKISIIQDEPSGFAIDNVEWEDITSSIVFREKSGDDKDGTWGFFVDEIPGFDHVGLNFNGVVYESHPGYPSGTYISSSGNESVTVSTINGVQNQHSFESFKHDSKTSSSPVIDFESIPISNELATLMHTRIESVLGNGFQRINYSIDGLSATLSPTAQKGGGGTYTCVGLIEWAAEQAGHKNGEGFIPNNLESITATNPFDETETLEIPFLSPSLLNYFMKENQPLENTEKWVVGFFDPVDFIITDPLGRRIGFTEDMGVINEIPYAFYSGDGNIENVIIPKSIPGAYTFKLQGKDEDMLAVLSSEDTTSFIKENLKSSDTVLSYILIDETMGMIGDVNEDSSLDSLDLYQLELLLNTFTNTLGHPGDIDGDGLISNNDLLLLGKLINVVDSIPNIPAYEPKEVLSTKLSKLINVYPNPSKSFVKFDFEHKIKPTDYMEIYDIKGKHMLTLHPSHHNSNFIIWDVRNFPSGLYIYKTSISKELVTGKILIK